MATKTYPVLRALLHDGELYDPEATPGVTVDLDEVVAASLPEGVLGEGVETAEPDPNVLGEGVETAAAEGDGKKGSSGKGAAS